MVHNKLLCFKTLNATFPWTPGVEVNHLVVENFLNNLGIALALENWLQEKLQVFCDATVVEIEGLTAGI